MNLRPGRLDFYLARAVLLATAATAAVLLSFDLVGALLNELDEVGEGGYTLSHAFLYTLYTSPRRLYELFPTSALIGTVLGLGGLAARSELTAMRAVGVSRLRIGLGALLSSALLAGLMVVNAETAAPQGEQSAQTVANSAKAGDVVMARVSGLWARDGNTFLNARDGQRRELDGRAWTELQGVRLFEFDIDGRLASLVVARTAEHRDGYWTLHGLRRTRFDKRSVQVEELDTERWQTTLGDELVSAAVKRPRYMSSRELLRNIDYLDRNGLDAKAFENAYWARWFYPLNVVVLCLSALPFAFGSLRSGGFGKRLFIAVVIGVGYLLAQRLVVSLSDVYRFDARLAYLLPPAVLMAVCWGLFGRRD
ncbi:LPS export ABC transporter permease LptG [Arenimonas caeni]|jgi:lipopolysaccharide export system permease protein|uniref:LPS export ABC transporter permease LptG n=1 Tax=Arenimonas caeni TaxID=2058085 RepID=UPI002A36E7D8|nr:LPS export ABC transporter permease LptG [Arenimonas caeni]MDY0022817.1 LPS export ABC transporter permease LptG [Arenimonas caeni]